MTHSPTDPTPLAPCATCGFAPWHRDDPRCEIKGCGNRARHWWHGEGGIHWLICESDRVRRAISGLQAEVADSPASGPSEEVRDA